MVPRARPSPQPKRHLDQFSRFCGAHYSDKPRYSVCNNRPRSRSTAMQPNDNCNITVKRSDHTIQSIMNTAVVDIMTSPPPGAAPGESHSHAPSYRPLWVNITSSTNRKYNVFHCRQMRNARALRGEVCYLRLPWLKPNSITLAGSQLAPNQLV